MLMRDACSRGGWAVLLPLTVSATGCVSWQAHRDPVRVLSTDAGRTARVVHTTGSGQLDTLRLRRVRVQGDSLVGDTATHAAGPARVAVARTAVREVATRRLALRPTLVLIGIPLGVLAVGFAWAVAHLPE
jgi:hypothetical protein